MNRVAILFLICLSFPATVLSTGSPFERRSGARSAITQNRPISESLARDYVQILNTTPWSMSYNDWVARFGKDAVLDTFQHVPWHLWEYEKYCFKARIQKDSLTCEYSFYDNGDYIHPEALLQQILIIDARTRYAVFLYEDDEEINQNVWDLVSDSLTKEYGLSTDVPEAETLTPFYLGALPGEKEPRFWQDSFTRIILTPRGRDQHIMLLARGKRLDSLLDRMSVVEEKYAQELFGEMSIRNRLCEALRKTDAPWEPLCHTDPSRKTRLEEIVRFGEFCSKTGDSSNLPLYRLALFQLGQRYDVQSVRDSLGRFSDVELLKRYEILFVWPWLHDHWVYSREPLVRIYTDHPDNPWAQFAFAILQHIGWCLDNACNDTHGPEVVAKGEEFLARYPNSKCNVTVLLTIAKGHETNWNVSTTPPPNSPVNRNDQTSRQQAIAAYERVIKDFPNSPEAEIAKLRLPRLKLGVSTDRTDYDFFYD